MLLGDIDIPESLLTAHKEGRLVIFTGAGVSMDPPSSLPSFRGLTRLVATRVQTTADPDSPEWEAQPDAFLGSLDDNDRYNVHRLVARIVTDRNSEPNQNHDALARIATKSSPRVVTTNYDLHLESRLAEHSAGPIDVFQAPAVPLGDNFSGLVYLHGSAAAAPERLVVTDRDFSKAYFHAAWAARFVERMFNHYAVLFVGYSHSDVVMKYLGLGVGPNAERYVITDDPDNAIWERLRVKTLAYPKGDHGVLTQALTEWADLAEMGLLEHRQRIRTIVAGTAPSAEQSIAKRTPPNQLSYLQDCIRRPDRVGFFCTYASDPGWLDWIAGEPTFRAIFDQQQPPNQVTERLATWFVETFAFTDEETAKEAWRVFAASGGTLSTALWNALVTELHRYTNERPGHVRQWIWLLIAQEHAGCYIDWLDYALEWDGVWEDRELTLALLAHLLEPQLKSESNWPLGGLAVDTRGDQHWLDQAWSNKFKPDLQGILFEVFPIVDQALKQHLVLEERVGGGAFGFSWRRPAIQPHVTDKDHHRSTIDVLIDAARDCIEVMWTVSPERANQITRRWSKSPYTLLHRLAIHGVANSPALEADARVQFLINSGIAAERDSLQETYQLLATAAPELSPCTLDELIATYAPDGDAVHEQFKAFTAYNVLIRSGAQYEPLRVAFDAIQEVHNFTADEYPGMNGGVFVSWVGDHPPLTPEEFEQKVLDSPVDAISYINAFEDRLPPRGSGPTREDALAMLRGTVRDKPTLGLALWPHATHYLDVQGAIVSAWGHLKDPDSAAAVIAALNSADLRSLQHQVGQFLLYAAQAKDVPWDIVPGVDEFIDAFWHACGTHESFESAEGTDWLSVIINVPVGHLMDFWFRVFHLRWAAAGDAWGGLPEADRNFLNRALDDRTTRGAHALTQISGRLAYLDQADSIWCREQLLPLHSWSEPLVAEPFWWGVLSFGRWNSGLVVAGLLRGLIDTGNYLDMFTRSQRRRWAGFLASIAVRTEFPRAATWVSDFTAVAAPADRELWIGCLNDELEALDEQGRETVWTTWLYNYWHNRTQDVPVMFEQAEMNAFASIAPRAPATAFETAVALVASTPAGFQNHAEASRGVTDDLIDTQPLAAGRFYTHLMTNTEPAGFNGVFEVRPKLARITSKPGDWSALVAAALRLGMDLSPA